MPNSSARRILPEADEYVKEWNRREPTPGYEMVSFTRWHRRVYGVVPATISLEYVQRYAHNYKFKG
jgi:hypothetical protein